MDQEQESNRPLKRPKLFHPNIPLTETAFPFGNLPPEIVQIILEKMPFNDKLRVSRVCSQWFQLYKLLSTDVSLYFTKSNQIGDIAHYFTHDHIIYGLTLLKSLRLTDEDHEDLLWPMTQLTSLKVSSKSYIGEGLNSLVNLQRIEAEAIQPETVLKLSNLTKLDASVRGLIPPGSLPNLEYISNARVRFMQTFPNPARLTHLVTSDVQLITPARLAEFSNLKTLRLSSAEHISASIDLPNLEKFYAFHEVENLTSTRLTELYLYQKSASKIELRKLTALKRLRMACNVAADYERALPELSNLEALFIPGHCPSQLLDLINPASLTSLRLPCDTALAEKLTRLTNLENLEAEVTGNNSLRLPSGLTILTTLKVTGVVDSKSVELLTKLQTLELNSYASGWNLGSLTLLTSLLLGSYIGKVLNLSALANLKDLRVLVEEFDFTGLEALTNLESLYYAGYTTKSLWNALPYLTNIERAALPHLTNEEVLHLTSLNKLTSLNAYRFNNEGRVLLYNVTCLTKLQSLTHAIPAVGAESEVMMFKAAVEHALPDLHTLELRD